MYKKRDLLNEIAGVPKVLEQWVELFIDISIELIDDAVKTEGWQDESSGEAKNPQTGEIEQVTAYRTMKVYEGKQVMDMISQKTGSDLKSFMKSDLFKGLPLWRPSVELEIIGVPDFLYQEEMKEIGMNAALGTNPKVQKLGRIGKMDVIKEIKLVLKPMLPEDSDKGLSEETIKVLRRQLRTTIGHELLHAYQHFKQMEGGKPAHFGREMLLNAMANHPHLQTQMFKEWDHFLRLVYLHLSFEINARVNELYYEMKNHGVEDQQQFLKVLKNSHIWDEVKALESFDAKQFMRDFKLPKIEGGFLEQMLGQTMMDMELKMRRIDPSSDDAALKSLIKLWDVILQQGSEAMIDHHGVSIPMDKVPESAKKDPYKFFQFFEKRFHRKAEKFKRKLYRVVTAVLQNDEVQAESVKKKDLLKEIAGVPEQITKWNEVFGSLVLGSINEAVYGDKTKWKKIKGTMAGKKVKGAGKHFNISEGDVHDHVKVSYMDGKSMNDVDLLKNKDFKKFPMWKPAIRISLYGIEDKYWNRDEDILVEASFNTNPDTRIQDEEWKALVGVGFQFQIYFNLELLKKKEDFVGLIKPFVQETYGVIAHELLHAYQFYQETKDKELDTAQWHYGQESVLNWAKQVMDGVSKSQDWNDFMYLVYLHLSFEINARITQLQYEMKVKGVKDLEGFRKYLETSEIYKHAQRLLDFNAEEFVNNFESPLQDVRTAKEKFGYTGEIGWEGLGQEIKDVYNTLDHYLNPILNWERLKLLANKDAKHKHMLKALIDRWDTTISQFEDIFDDEEGGKYENLPKMEPVPEYAKQDPIKFFKFFEKRFHKRGEEFKRKIHKLAAHFQDKDSLGEKRPGVYGRMADRRKPPKYQYQGKSDIRESEDFEWIEKVETGSDHYLRQLRLLEKIFEGSEFEVKYNNRVSYKQTADVWKGDGQYTNFWLNNYPLDWLVTARRDYHQAINICGEECDLTEEFRKIYNIIATYLSNELNVPTRLIESEDFDWIEDSGIFLDDLYINKYKMELNYMGGPRMMTITDVTEEDEDLFRLHLEDKYGRQLSGNMDKLLDDSPLLDKDGNKVNRDELIRSFRARLWNESEDLEWIGDMSNPQFEELKGMIYNVYPEAELEEDNEHGILRMKRATYLNNGTLTEVGFAFTIDRVIETIPEKIIYSIGEYDEIWSSDNLGNKFELVDSDLSFSALGNIDEIEKYLHSTSIGRDGRPYTELNESEDFEWIGDITPTPPREFGDLRIGDIIYIGDKRQPRYRLEIVDMGPKENFHEYYDDLDVEEDTIALYKILHSNNEDEPEGSIHTIGLERAEQLITGVDNYWKYEYRVSD